MTKIVVSVVAVTFIQLVGCQKPVAPLNATLEVGRIDVDVDPCITVGYSSYGRGTPGTGLILAVWRDGRVVYSEDFQHGGPPFLSGKVMPEKIEALISVIAAAPWFDGQDDNTAYPVYGRAVFYSSESQYEAIYRHRFDDWLRATPVVSIEELTKLIETQKLNGDSYWVDSEGTVVSASEVIGRSMSILIPDDGVPFVTTLSLRNY